MFFLGYCFGFQVQLGNALPRLEFAPLSAFSQDLSHSCNVRSPHVELRPYGLLRLSSFTAESALRLGLHTGTHRYRRVAEPLSSWTAINFFSSVSGLSSYWICLNSDQDSCSALVFVAASTRHASSSTIAHFKEGSSGKNSWIQFVTGSCPASLLDLPRIFPVIKLAQNINPILWSWVPLRLPTLL